MAGNFSNLRYDNEAYNEAIQRSTNPLNYRLDPNYANNCNQCFPTYGPRGLRNTNPISELIDTDSILHGVNQLNTKSNRRQMPEFLEERNPITLPNCPETLEQQYSRYTHPKFDIKGLNVRDLRLEYPLYDPQCNIFENFAVNTRLQAKDNHRTVWQIPFNQKDLLPTERLGRIKNCDVSLNCNYAPFP